MHGSMQVREHLLAECHGQLHMQHKHASARATEGHANTSELHERLLQFPPSQPDGFGSPGTGPAPMVAEGNARLGGDGDPGRGTHTLRAGAAERCRIIDIGVGDARLPFASIPVPLSFGTAGLSLVSLASRTPVLPGGWRGAAPRATGNSSWGPRPTARCTRS